MTNGPCVPLKPVGLMKSSWNSTSLRSLTNTGPPDVNRAATADTKSPELSNLLKLCVAKFLRFTVFLCFLFPVAVCTEQPFHRPWSPHTCAQNVHGRHWLQLQQSSLNARLTAALSGSATLKFKLWWADQKKNGLKRSSTAINYL